MAMTADGKESHHDLWAEERPARISWNSKRPTASRWRYRSREARRQMRSNLGVYSQSAARYTEVQLRDTVGGRQGLYHQPQGHLGDQITEADAD
jgi:hypothetical protein